MFRMLLACWMLLFAAQATAWWNADWPYRKGWQIDTSAETGVNLDAPAGDVPVLIRLHSGNFAYFLDVGDGGKDLRFMSRDDQTPLKYHIERFDPINEMALIWVKLPALQPLSADQKIWMYYGNPLAPPADDAGATYDANQVLVYHFADRVGDVVDATAYASNPASITAELNPAALIGAGVSFNGEGTLTIADSPALTFNETDGWSLSSWLKLGSALEAPGLLFDRADENGRLSLIVEGATLYARYTDAAGAVTETPRTAQIPTGAWAHVAFVVRADGMAVFINGREVATVPAQVAPVSGDIVIGGSTDEEEAAFLVGEMDELQISNTARDAGWFKLAVDGQGVGARLVTDAGDETEDTEGASESEGHGGYFGIIFQNVFGKKEALVEQAVIIVCLLMLVVAAMIMVLKAMYLSNAQRATKRFLNAYGTLEAEEDHDNTHEHKLESFYDANKTFGDSPLFKLYRQGIDELRKRRTATAGAAGVGIDSKGLTTMRAALDAVMVREGQKLNSLMVLLTIAISGGPFIGLFGTVVGVMITFAAIAATGDVNITAIAPGMAAALLATVAGLGVAIPSLFGYNYLGSKIKELQADMAVFADEFIARINEEYGA